MNPKEKKGIVTVLTGRRREKKKKKKGKPPQPSNGKQLEQVHKGKKGREAFRTGPISPNGKGGKRRLKCCGENLPSNESHGKRGEKKKERREGEAV